MLEYIIFHKQLADAFIVELQRLSIPAELKDDEMGFIVAIPEDLDRDLLTQVDEHYTSLLAESANLMAEDDDAGDKHVAGITINLCDGRTVQALVKPELLNKILEAISFEELNEFVEAITDAVENPDERPICQR